MGLFSSSLSARDMAHLCHQLDVLYDAGVPLVQALRNLEESQASRPLRQVAGNIRQAIEVGATFAEAVHGQEKRLSPAFAHLVGVADAAGGLGEVFSQLTRYYEDLRNLYRAVIRQVAYPAAVLAAILVAIPILTAFLSDVAGISRAPFANQLYWILRNGALNAGGVFLAIVILSRLTLRFTTRESILMHCWPFSGIVRSILLSRFAWAMMLFTRSGLPLHHAVRLAGRVTGAHRIAGDFEKLAPLLQAGYSLSETLAQSRFLSGRSLTYIRMGELAGKLDMSFEHLSRGLYDDAVFRLRILIGLIEPLAILGLGALTLMRVG